MAIVKRIAVLGIVLALAALATSPATAQEQDPLDGYLVVVPGFPEIGQTTLVVGLGLEWDTAYGIEWTNHFTLEGEPCGDSGGTVHENESGELYAKLVACRPGDAPVRLYIIETGQVVDEEVALVSGRPEVRIWFEDESSAKPGERVSVLASFSEPVFLFDLDDILVVGGEASYLLERSGADVYSFYVSADSSAGTVILIRGWAAYSISETIPNVVSNRLTLEVE